MLKVLQGVKREVFFTAVLIILLYNRFTPRQIARSAYVLATGGARGAG
jgi:hypothetical protein